MIIILITQLSLGTLRNEQQPSIITARTYLFANYKFKCQDYIYCT